MQTCGVNKPRALNSVQLAGIFGIRSCKQVEKNSSRAPLSTFLCDENAKSFLLAWLVGEYSAGAAIRLQPRNRTLCSYLLHTHKSTLAAEGVVVVAPLLVRKAKGRFGEGKWRRETQRLLQRRGSFLGTKTVEGQFSY